MNNIKNGGGCNIFLNRAQKINAKRMLPRWIYGLTRVAALRSSPSSSEDGMTVPLGNSRYAVELSEDGRRMFLVYIVRLRSLLGNSKSCHMIARGVPPSEEAGRGSEGKHTFFL